MRSKGFFCQFIMGVLFLQTLLITSCYHRIQESSNYQFDQASILERMRSDILWFSSDTINGIANEANYLELASHHLYSQFRKLGLQTIVQKFEVKSTNKTNDIHENIIGILDHNSDSTFVISAHYDRVVPGIKSLEIRNPNGFHPCADDNGSGVALLLELARQMVSNTSKKYNYLFVALDAHEIGLFGSAALCKSDILKAYKIKTIINLDMLGRLNPQSKTVRLSYCDNHPKLKNLVSEASNSKIKMLLDDEHITKNDLENYCIAGFPSISLTTGIHDDYHKTGDTIDKINFEGLSIVLNFVLAIIS